MSKNQNLATVISIIAEVKNTSAMEQRDTSEETATTSARRQQENSGVPIDKQYNNINSNNNKKIIEIDFPIFFTEKEKSLFIDFLEIKKKMKKPTTKSSQELAIKKLMNI